MDSLSQLVLGAAVAAAVVPAHHRRRALLAGAVLGTLPDLDVVPLNLLVEDPVARAVWHRGASHSLFVLPFVGALLWALLRRIWTPVREAPRAWFVAVQLAFVTHVLLDALTIYGTQLFWSLPTPPVMVGSVFIIDPLYTLWLVVAVVVAWWRGERPAARRWLLVGLFLSTAYLGWSLVAKSLVERETRRALVELGHGDAPHFSVPTPLNTLLWRVVALVPGGYVEGTYSLAAPGDRLVFESHTSDTQALLAASNLTAVRRLQWWNRGFLRAEVQGDRLVLSDLRMGAHPDFIFRFEVAERTDAGWTAVPPVQLPWPSDSFADAGALWGRIWTAAAVPVR